MLNRTGIRDERFLDYIDGLFLTWCDVGRWVQERVRCCS
jgi:hypothetical protein